MGRVLGSEHDQRLYLQMARMRRFEEALRELWNQGLISGELHLGIGEEAIAAAVVDHLREGDAMALDHRPTPLLVGLGISLEAMLLEVLGHPSGLSGGMGGHMHLFSRAHLATSSGIVGAPGPTACGLALSAQRLRPNAVAVACFGEGAMNQGMMMESLNLAAVWRLPVVFVCKDNRWSISTVSYRVTGGRLTKRAEALGVRARRVDGTVVNDTWRVVRYAVARARAGEGPTFIHATCFRPSGHFEDDPLVRMAGSPRELAGEARSLLRSLGAPGPDPLRDRLGGIRRLVGTIGRMRVDQLTRAADPLRKQASRLPPGVARRLMSRADAEVENALATALPEVSGS